MLTCYSFSVACIFSKICEIMPVFLTCLLRKQVASVISPIEENEKLKQMILQRTEVSLQLLGAELFLKLSFFFF